MHFTFNCVIRGFHVAAWSQMTPRYLYCGTYFVIGELWSVRLGAVLGQCRLRQTWRDIVFDCENYWNPVFMHHASSFDIAVYSRRSIICVEDSDANKTKSSTYSEHWTVDFRSLHISFMLLILSSFTNLYYQKFAFNELYAAYAIYSCDMSRKFIQIYYFLSTHALKIPFAIHWKFELLTALQ